jgi:hypothetical protein
MFACDFDKTSDAPVITGIIVPCVLRTRCTLVSRSLSHRPKTFPASLLYFLSNDKTASGKDTALDYEVRFTAGFYPS